MKRVTDTSKSMQRITFDCSAIDAAIRYLRVRSKESLDDLISMPGNRLAYDHYRWSSFGSKLGPDGFWREQLDEISYTDEFEQNIVALRRYLEARSRSDWLNEILWYLPPAHTFKTMVYMIVGYDNIVFGEDVALNFNNTEFKEDCREAVYFLIHELAHAGYLRYHRMPDLAGFNTCVELATIIKFLTHLEGMGVISSIRLRAREEGFLDKDYNVLRNEVTKAMRVRDYFRILSRLESEPERRIERARGFEIYNKLSGQPRRLWYITGCHMAQTIETKLGIGTLRELVRKGSLDFFKTYFEIEDPLRENLRL
jgi:hypothetical protein